MQADTQTSNEQKALAEAVRMRSYLPFRIHYIYCLNTTPDFWQAGCSITMRMPNSLARKGAVVKLLTN